VTLQSRSAERAARRTGATVLAGDAATVQFPAEGFDLICGWMVFEHLEDPRAAMAQCLRWLRPGGWLAFSVPDCGSWQFRFFGSEWYALQLPTHLHHFTVPVLSRWLAALGYQSVRVRWQGTLLDVPLSVAYFMESRGWVCAPAGSPGRRQAASRYASSPGWSGARRRGSA